MLEFVAGGALERELGADQRAERAGDQQRLDLDGGDLAGGEPDHQDLPLLPQDPEGVGEPVAAHLLAAQEDPESLYLVGLGSVPLLVALGDLMVGWMLLRSARVALDRLPDAGADDEGFYTDKITVANPFARSHPPQVASARATIDSLDLDVMRMPEGAFKRTSAVQASDLRCPPRPV